MNHQPRHSTTDFSINNHELCRNAILSFCESGLFSDNGNRYEENYYGRRLRPHVVNNLDFSKPAAMEEPSNYQAFAANRILFVMNESDFLMMPDKELDLRDFNERYSSEKIAQSYVGMPYLENYLFSFLSNEVVSSENWSLDGVEEYFLEYQKEAAQVQRLESAEAIIQSNDPGLAARDWLIQLAPDFLIESSPMARYASGNYGELSSSLFKIIIDELGYGEHKKKHSTLFEETLKSAGISPEPHKYWQYYLNGSLLLANYYNCITRNRKNIFRYIGAIFLAETGFIRSCAIWRDALKKAIPELDVRYFDEHIHIDVDHSRMAFDSLVRPAIKSYGTYAANEIVRGFEEARIIGEIAESDFVKQIRWKDNAKTNQEIYKNIWPKIKKAFDEGKVSRSVLNEPRGELSITHSHDLDELCHVTSGKMEFLNGFQVSSILGDDDGIVIEKNRLHGALIHSDSCSYEIYTIGDVNRWL